MESILEYKAKQIRIKVPKWVEEYSKWIEKNVTIDTEFEAFEKKYNKLQEWYENKASVIFDDSDLFMDGFYNLTKEMDEDGILDFCKFN